MIGFKNDTRTNLTCSRIREHDSSRNSRDA